MRRWLAIVALLVIGAIIGAGVIIASTEVNRFASTDAFCTSCHSMATIAADSHYRQSVHRTNAAGVLATCGDCHIPTNNWFVETYTHAVEGIRDGIAEYMSNVSDPAVWAARLPVLAERVRDEMRRENGITCRKCHDAAVIRPASKAGRAAHALLAQVRMTCIDCHSNLVHAPISASASFLYGSGRGRPNPNSAVARRQ